MSMLGLIDVIRRKPPGLRDGTLPYTDPLNAGRHPFQMYILSLCVLTSAPILLGKATAEAVAHSLPVWLAFTWGVFLFVGSTTALVGAYWGLNRRDVGLTLERVGLDLTGAAALVYGMCVLGVKSPIAPAYGLMVIIGVVVLALALTNRTISRPGRWVGMLSGILAITGGMGLLATTPALNVLVAAAIILGFGASCMRRAYDISRIFHRASQSNAERPVIATEEE